MPPAFSQSALLVAFVTSPAKAGPVKASAKANASIETSVFMDTTPYVWRRAAGKPHLIANVPMAATKLPPPGRLARGGREALLRGPSPPSLLPNGARELFTVRLVRERPVSALKTGSDSLPKEGPGVANRGAERGAGLVLWVWENSPRIDCCLEREKIKGWSGGVWHLQRPFPLLTGGPAQVPRICDPTRARA
jgi:hypothetical protein